MTLVTLNLLAAGGTPAIGSVVFSPSRRLHSTTQVFMPSRVEVDLIVGQASVELLATDDPRYGTGWAWTARERVQGAAALRVFLVPTSATALQYAALTDVDPASLAPNAAPPAAWVVALAALTARVAALEAGGGTGVPAGTYTTTYAPTY